MFVTRPTREFDPVYVEYDGPLANRRIRKLFRDVFAARRFYAAQARKGTNPRVVKAEAR